MPVRDLLIEQSLPVNLDAERFVLGGIMTDEAAFLAVGGKINEDDFSLEKHKMIFRRMSDLHDRSERIDRVTLANELMKHGELQSVDGLSYLVTLDDGLPQLYSLESYVTIVKEKALLRRIITVSQGLINRCISGTEDPTQIIGAAEEALIGLGDFQSKSSLSNPAQIIDDFDGGINAFLDTSKRIKGISTGFLKLDEMTGGLREGELVILAARPAMGKTAFALNIAQHVATNPKNAKAVAVFSLEMSKESLLTRMLCAAARVDQQKFRAGYLNHDERTRLQESATDMYHAPLFIDDTAGVESDGRACETPPLAGGTRSGPGHYRLPSTNARPETREPCAGDQQLVARAETDVKGSACAVPRAVAAKPRARNAPGRSPADAQRLARIGIDRTGRRYGDVHFSRGSLSARQGKFEGYS